MNQRPIVEQSLTHEPGSRCGRFDTRTYTVQRAWLVDAPMIDEIVWTLPGVYWRVVRWQSDDRELTLRLAPVNAHSVEAHGTTRELYGGVLS